MADVGRTRAGLSRFIHTQCAGNAASKGTKLESTGGPVTF